MPIKFFCDSCGKEIWQEMPRTEANLSEIISIGECLCSGCFADKLIIEIAETENERR
jgi:hypothetical protein